MRHALAVFLLALFLLAACATVPKPIYPHGPLIEQRLAPRPGYVGRLTNQVCAERADPKDADKCTKFSVLEYDLRVQSTRDQLQAVKLVCNVGGERYRVARFKAGLMQDTYKGVWPFRRYREVDFIPIVNGYQRLLDANTVCAAQESTLGRTLFSKLGKLFEEAGLAARMGLPLRWHPPLRL